MLTNSAMKPVLPGMAANDLNGWDAEGILSLDGGSGLDALAKAAIRKGVITLGQGATRGLERWTFEDLTRATSPVIRCVTSRRSRSTHFLSGAAAERFNDFWDNFGLKSGRAGAAWSWYQLEASEPGFADEVFPRIKSAAAIEAGRRASLTRNGGTPKWAQGWLTERRWEDGIYDDAASFTPRQKALIDAYHASCSPAQGYLPVSGWTEKRAMFIDEALVRRNVETWAKYFSFIRHLEPDIAERRIKRELFSLIHPEISETLVELLKQKVLVRRGQQSETGAPSPAAAMSQG